MSDSGRVMVSGVQYSQNIYVHSWGLAPDDFLNLVTPANGSLVVGNLSLMWTVDGEDSLDWVYDLYLGTTSSLSTPIATNLTNLNYSASSLTPGTKYYWKVVMKDSDSVVLTSEVREFTVQTAPSITLKTHSSILPIMTIK